MHDDLPRVYEEMIVPEPGEESQLEQLRRSTATARLPKDIVEQKVLSKFNDFMGQAQIVAKNGTDYVCYQLKWTDRDKDIIEVDRVEISNRLWTYLIKKGFKLSLCTVGLNSRYVSWE